MVNVPAKCTHQCSIAVHVMQWILEPSSLASAYPSGRKRYWGSESSQRLIAPPKAAQTGAGGAVVGSRCSVSISRSTPCPWVSKLETQNGLDVFVKGEHLRVERLWPLESYLSDEKSWLIGKNPNAGKDWGIRRRVDRGWDGWMASPTQWTWVEQILGDGDGQGSLMCCCRWGCKELKMTEGLSNWTAILHRVHVLQLPYLFTSQRTSFWFASMFYLS